MFIKDDSEGGYLPTNKKPVYKGDVFEYSQVIFHRNRDGPHKDEEFGKFSGEYCHQMKRKWYLQAPRV